MLGAFFTLPDFDCDALSFSDFYSQNIDKAMKLHIAFYTISPWLRMLVPKLL